jgi:hypothetical protein
MEITRQMLKDLRPEIEDALSGISAKYGIEMKVGNGSYSGLSGHLKLNLSTTGENGETPESRDFEILASDYGMDKEWFGKTFTVNGDSYTIAGILPKKRKMPILVVGNKDGSKRIMDSGGVRIAMKRAGYKVPTYWGAIGMGEE